jgi:hypothetical protein
MSTEPEVSRDAIKKLHKDVDFAGEADADNDAKELSDFLKEREGRFFNAPRIRALENAEPKPRSFVRLSNQEIYRLLRKLLAAGSITTKVSQKGNTLYGA